MSQKIFLNMETDLIIEENMRIHPFEIKLTKTPLIRMASQIEGFKKTFTKLNILNGNIISLSDDDHLLTKNVSAISFNTYMEYLSRIVQILFVLYQPDSSSERLILFLFLTGAAISKVAAIFVENLY